MRASILRLPYDSYSSGQLLRHFRSRDYAHFFSVADEDATQREKIDAILKNRFEFNNEAHDLPHPIAWTCNPSTDIEWHILLHKAYYLVGLGLAYEDTGDNVYLDKWIELIESWIRETPVGFIASDVTGRRIQNWIYSLRYFVFDSKADLPQGFLERMLRSIHEQVTYLLDHLAPARNHRTLELYAIFLAAVALPELKGAPEWQSFALEQIVQNMESDLRPDGVHCEQSSDYHHIVVRNYLCVRRLALANDIAVPVAFDILLQKALEFSMYLHKPDGIVPALSDGDARSYLDLLHQGFEIYSRGDFLYLASHGFAGRVPPRRSIGFQDGGYYILRSGWGESEPYEHERYLVFDCGPLGVGNHGHLDLLSFEMAAFGRSLIVDPGRYTYDETGKENWRVKFRGTAYHNTVVVDGKNQTRYAPGPEKWKIQGDPPDYELIRFASTCGADIVHGTARSHEYDALHERCIMFFCGEYWLIVDRLHAKTPHDYDLMFHLNAEAWKRTHVSRDGRLSLVDAPSLCLAQPDVMGVQIRLERGFVSTSYGQKRESPIVRYRQSATLCDFATVVLPYLRSRPRVAIEEIPVTFTSNEKTLPYAKAYSITRERDGRRVRDVCMLSPASESCPKIFENFCYDGTHLMIRFEDSGSVNVLYQDEGSRLEYESESSGSWHGV